MLSVRITGVPRFRRRRGFARRSLCRRSEAASIADLKWFEVFNDPELQNLVRTALQRNYDLRDAVARVEEARASLGITRSNQYPNFGVGASVEINRVSRDGATPIPTQLLPSQNRNFGTAALELLSFEIDIWGRLRRETEAARANLLGAEETRKAVVTTLVSDVATAYLTLRELDYTLEISQRTLLDTRAVPGTDAVTPNRRSRYPPGPAAGRTTGADGGGDHPRHPAADRADGESDQPAAWTKSRQRGARTEPHRSGRCRRKFPPVFRPPCWSGARISMPPSRI